MYDIDIYKTYTGKEPYTEWQKNLDKCTSSRIDARFAKIRQTGNFGVHKPVGEGVFELKFDFGPGYRIYFGFEDDKLLILLCGGHKGTQQSDIIKAKKYWREYKEGKNEKIQKLQRGSNRKTKRS